MKRMLHSTDDDTVGPAHTWDKPKNLPNELHEQLIRSVQDGKTASKPDPDHGIRYHELNKGG